MAFNGDTFILVIRLSKIWI